MATIPTDPFEPGGITRFAKRFRKGEISSEEATRAYLDRIKALDSKLQAFEYVAGERALATARAMDQLLAAGTDLGPLMGVPVAVKDLIAVEGMPTTAGSLTDVTDIIGPEGSFVKGLKRSGCVILGKVTCIEFAYGTLGINRRRTPWNPWDAKTQRIVGGSSSGSATAVAAGLCAFAIGTDTGASVRLPAGLCGTFGLRTSPELWSTEGVFPLVESMDSIGPLTKSAADAALVFAALTGQPVPQPSPLGGMRLGHIVDYMNENLDADVAKCMDAALADLKKGGAEIVPIEVPEAAERSAYFPVALPAYAMASLSRERYLATRDQMDTIVAARCAPGLDIQAAEFIRVERRRAALCRIIAERMAGFDGWVTPTMAITAPAVADFDDVEKSMPLTIAITQNTQPGSLFGLCGTSSPIHKYRSDLPVGLQIMCPPDRIAKALSIALAVENVTGLPRQADLAGFL